MKTKILSLLVILAIAVVSCQKDETDKPVAKQDVSFGIEHVDPIGLKSDIYDIECPENLTPVKAKVVISYFDEENNPVTETFNPLVFSLNGKWYTQAIKLVPGNYTIKQFYLLDANDEEIMATPAKGSDYAVYVEEGVDIGFLVEAFKKAEIAIDVLCYEEAKYTEFGFFWFQVDRIVVREKCFFGDICLKSLNDYLGSLYVQQENGLQIDMPAIFEIRAFRGIMENDEVIKGAPLPKPVFSNEDWLGEGAPLCVEWPDNIDIEEYFVFELYIYVASGAAFDYVYFHTWTFMDDELIALGGDDGVIDFVLGNCNYSYTDLQLAPYINLPSSAEIKISHDIPSYNNNTWDWLYWKLEVKKAYDQNGELVPAPHNYDILNPNNNYAAFCGDGANTMPVGTFIFDVYNPLTFDFSSGILAPHITEAKLNSVHWLINNLGTYGYEISGLYIDEGELSTPEAKQIQDAIWIIINGENNSAVPWNYTIGELTPNEFTIGTMASQATTLGASFNPLPGQWSSVLLVRDHQTQGKYYQLIFTVIDP